MRLQTVLDANLCSGCGLCAALLGEERASMQLKEPGYLRPVVQGELSSDEESLIADVCPGNQVELPKGADNLAAPELGPLLSVATGYATDASLRHNASSGGAISAVLSHLMATGETHYVLQVAASHDVPWLNTVVTSGTVMEVHSASGSRYAPSAPLEPLIRCLEEGRPFAVVGKPCDIAALRAYAKRDPRVDQLVTVMIAFMCGGIPSARGVKRLVERMGADPGEVVEFRFRGDGWPGRAKAVTRTGSEHSLSYDESWGGVLSKHLQTRCKICADGTGMSADIVCADAWYGDASGYPRFDEAAGRSLVLGRTPKGVAHIEAANRDGHLALQALDGGEIEKMQPYQIRRTRLIPSRLLAMRLFGYPATRYCGLRLSRFAFRAGLRENLESFLRMAWRAARRKL